MEGGKFGVRRNCRCAVLAGLALLGSSTRALAGSFRVDPVQIELPPDRQAAALTIANSGTSPVSIRVETLEWSQTGGLDRYAPTGNVIVSPPIFTIPAGKTQLVRVGLRNRAGAHAYRVIFEEIPNAKPEGGQVEVALRLNLPLYVESAGKSSKPQLQWSARSDSGGNLILTAWNGGMTHAQIVQLVANQNGHDQLLSRQMGVVLPNSSRSWRVGRQPDLKPGTPFLLKARGPAGETDAEVTPAQS
jgi:fimbrial chaperone protein